MIFQTMYGILCRAVSAALDVLPETPENAVGWELLQNALLEAEEVYLSDGEEDENQ